MRRRSRVVRPSHTKLIATLVASALLVVAGPDAPAAGTALSIDSPGVRVAGPGTGLELAWTITNSGDGAALARLEWSHGRDWAWPTTTTIDVPANGVVRYLTPVAVPDTAGAGDVQIVVQVTHQGDIVPDDSCVVVVVVLPAPPAGIVLENSADRVRLEWQTRMAPNGLGIVEKSLEGGPWFGAGGDRAGVDGRCVHEDRHVTPGSAVRYRLREWVNQMTMVSAVTTLRVPEVQPLRVTGLSPNPSRGTPAVSFTLPARAATRLDVFDAAGRRMWSRDLGVLAPGPHRYVLDTDRALRPGMYVFRIVQGNQGAVAHGVIVR